MSVGATWAGTHTFAAARLVEATTVAQVREAVAAGGQVRALGTRHSFSDLADSAGTLVTVTGLPQNPVIDAQAGTVSVGAGTRYGELAIWLEAQGWALHNMGSLPHISIAGAIATGTHGSGVSNGSLSSALRGMEYVNATGDVVTVRAGDPDFDAITVGLGAFGIAVRVTLAIQPSFQVRQDVYRGMTWATLLGELPAVMSAAYSVSVFTMWGDDSLDQVWRKTRLGMNGDGDVPDLWLGSTRQQATGARLVDGDPAWLTVQGGIPGPWLERLPHFRLDATPSNGDEIQTEYMVDLNHGAQALDAVRALADRIDPHLYITELRTIAADAAWLSCAYGRETLCIHFTWKNRPAEVRGAVEHIEAALAPFNARPHWGKVHGYGAAQIAAVTDRLSASRAVFERLDPAGAFSNAHLERVGLRQPRG